MKTKLTSIALGLLITSTITACSFIPKSSEPELGAALASGSADSELAPSLTVDGVLFDSNEATMKSDADEIVSQAVDYLLAHPDSRVLVEGHTDHTGPKSYNQTLSEKRAVAIAKAIKARGISTNRITAIGYGETNPVADNKTADGRRANRRVELHFAR